MTRPEPLVIDPHQHHRPPPGTRPWAPYVVGGLLGLLTWGAFLLLVVASAEAQRYDGQCEGIGWGCSPRGADAAGLAAILTWPALLVVPALQGLVGLVRPLVGERVCHQVRWWLAVGVPAVAAVAALALLAPRG